MLHLCLGNITRSFTGAVYHDYEGSGRSGEERGRFLANLGERHIMVLRNHGLIVVGETIGEALILTYRMERACAMQLQFQQSGAEFNPIDDGVVRAAIARGGAVSDHGFAVFGIASVRMKLPILYARAWS